ncbi:MAG: hypothetical protein ABI920_03550 [Casimicrobiaceae bacterium]
MTRPQPIGHERDDDASAADVLRATLRVNTIVLALVLGTIASATLAALAILGSYGDWHGPLVVSLIGVFLPGYDRTFSGVLAGAAWGLAIGAALGALIYRLNTLHVLHEFDALVVAERGDGDFPQGVLRLHGPSLGLAIGSTGAFGLLITTNLLVLRGTAGESVHARLLSEVLPGYRVTPLGSVIGALELFALLYLLCALFVAVYNGLAAWRRRAGAASAA